MGAKGIERQDACLMSEEEFGLPGPNIVMVGLMGAGKSAVGRRLAARLARTFVDADDEIEHAAGCSISDIFELYGEPAFRDVERRVIARLLDRPAGIISTGGGAFIDEKTRAAITAKSITVWLDADLETLVERTSRRNHRPLLRNGDAASVLAGLIESRYPIYAQADVTVKSEDCPVDLTVDRVIAALKAHGAGPVPKQAHACSR